MAASSTVEEKIYYTRVDRLLKDVGSEMMRNELNRHIPCTDLKRKVTASNNKHVRSKAGTLQAEIDQAHVDGYKKFDISFLYTLLRNLCQKQIPAPCGGWNIATKKTAKRPVKPIKGDSFPDPSEQNLGDDIERIHLIRNEIEHASSYSITKGQFDFYWYNLANVCQRMDARHSSLRNQYTALMKVIETCPMDDLSVKDEIAEIRGRYFVYLPQYEILMNIYRSEIAMKGTFTFGDMLFSTYIGGILVIFTLHGLLDIKK